MSETLTNGLFSKQLIQINQPYHSQEDFFRKISSWLYDQNLVTSTFFKAITEREAHFPTGLHTSTYDVAIPHTDPEHIQKPFIAIVRPASPLEFSEMGNLDGKCFARLVFIIGFKQSDRQLAILQKLMHMFSDQRAMDLLYQAENEDEILNTLTEFYESEK